MAAGNRVDAALRLGVCALTATLLAAWGTGSGDGSTAGSARTGSSVMGSAEPAGSTTGVTPRAPPIVLARAGRIATGGTGQQNRVEAPIEWVRTTLGAVWRIGRFRGDGNPTQPVYVIQLHGRFCCHPGPPGHDPTATSVFEILPVDGHSGDNLGGGGSTGHPLDLARLGTVRTFTLP